MLARIALLGPSLALSLAWGLCGECDELGDLVVVLHGDFESSPLFVELDGLEPGSCLVDVHAQCPGSGHELLCGDESGLGVYCSGGSGVYVSTPEMPGRIRVRILRGEEVLADREIAPYYSRCGSAYEAVDF